MPLAPIGRIPTSLGSQFCSHILVFSPFPILLIKPCFNTSRPSRIPLQIWDGLLPKSASTNYPFGKYIAFNNLVLSDSEFCIILQACRASNARLNISISWNPRPPRYFGCVIFSQDTQHVFLLPSSLPHQNFWIIALTAWQKPSRQLETTHRICGNCLSYSFDQDFFSTNW